MSEPGHIATQWPLHAYRNLLHAKNGTEHEDQRWRVPAPSPRLENGACDARKSQSQRTALVSYQARRSKIPGSSANWPLAGA
jgi:hypothetical protein